MRRFHFIFIFLLFSVLMGCEEENQRREEPQAQANYVPFPPMFCSGGDDGPRSDVIGELEIEGVGPYFGDRIGEYECGCMQWRRRISYFPFSVRLLRKYWTCMNLDQRCPGEPEEGVEIGNIQNTVEELWSYSTNGLDDLFPQCEQRFDLIQGVRFPMPECRVRVRKILNIGGEENVRSIGMFNIDSWVGVCLRDQGLAVPQYDVSFDLATVRWVPGRGLVFAPRQIRDFPEDEDPEIGARVLASATGGFLDDPWPQVTECMEFVVDMAYNAELYRTYEDRGIYAQRVNEGRDRDEDRVCSVIDTCPYTPNFASEQADFIERFDRRDRDGVGEACDNCPGLANATDLVVEGGFLVRPPQPDQDGDSIGDACDCSNEDTVDSDGDRVNDSCDNCPDVANSYADGDERLRQPNADGDEYGDICDPCPRDRDNDQDGDGVCESEDNCNVVANSDQANIDSDGYGDACEPDTDEDGVVDDDDNCDNDLNPDQLDQDGDGMGDECDPCPQLHAYEDVDADEDCASDAGGDNCLGLANEDQENSDGDARGDACDNCLNVDNSDQADWDVDRVGDLCDNCPAWRNPDQRDSNNNGEGDACEVPRPPVLFNFDPNTPRYINRDQLGPDQNAEVGRFVIEGNLALVQSVQYWIQAPGGAVVANGALFGELRSVTWNGMMGGEKAPVGAYVLTVSVDVRSEQNQLLTYRLSTPFTIYEIHFSQIRQQNAIAQPGAPPQEQLVPIDRLSLYVNNDNDDAAMGNLERDFVQQGPIPNEDDLVGVVATIEPPIAEGILRLDVVNNVQEQGEIRHVNAWSNSLKGNALALPYEIPLGALNPPAIYLEGLRAMTTPQYQQRPLSLLAQLNVQQPILPAKTIPLNLIQVDIVKDRNNNQIIECEPNQPENCGIGLVDETNPPVDFLRIGLWEHAFDENNNLYNEMAPERNFIDRDQERFYVRVIDSAANQNVDVKETIFDLLLPNGNEVYYSFVGVGPSFRNSGMSATLLEETGLDTGVFVSKSQLLTMGDLSSNVNGFDDNEFCGNPNLNGNARRLFYFCSDDFFPAHDGFQGPVRSFANNDRTHGVVNLQDDVWAFYASPSLPDLHRHFEQSIPICNRNPDERRVLYLRAIVFNEPYLDVGVARRNAQGEIEVVGQGDGQFTFMDRDGDGVCSCPDDIEANENCDAGEEECELFYDSFNDIRGERRSGYVPSLTQRGTRGPIINETELRRLVQNASRLWEQACIEVRLQSVEFRDAPQINGVDIFSNIPLETTGSERQFLIRNPGIDGRTETLDTLIIPWGTSNWGGLAYLPSPIASILDDPLVDDTAIFLAIARASDEWMPPALAHEIGHALTNRIHYSEVVPPPDLVTNFYPWEEWSHGFYYVNGSRRTIRLVIEDAHRVRPEGTENMEAAGNRLLQPYVPPPAEGGN